MNQFFPLLILVALPILVNAQLTEKDVFTSTSLVWCGLDYSNMRCIGKNISGEFADEDKIRNFYPTAWNELVIKEKDKYNIANYFRKETVIYAPSPAIKSSQNMATAPDDFITEESYVMESKTVKELVKQYEMKQESGIGLVYVIETLNEQKNHATMFVTFFDIATREVLFIQKAYSGSGGFGFRNYWISPVLGVHKYCKSMWKKWKKVAMK